MSAPLTVLHSDRVLVLAPHPDDETLAVGGLLQHVVAAGAALRVLVVTDGENNPWSQRVVERRWHVGPIDRERWGVRRRQEVMAAVDSMCLPRSTVSFLGLPDQGLTALLMQGPERVVQTLARVIMEARPTILVGPCPSDLHPDHSALAVLLRFTLCRLPLLARRMQVLSYLVHGDGRVVVPEARRRWLQLTVADVSRKRAAIAAHRSQLAWRRGRLFAFAGERETFAVDTPSFVALPRSVGAVRFEKSRLCIGLARPRRVGAFGARTLALVTEGPTGGYRWHGRLPTRGGCVELFEVSGRSICCRGTFERVPGGGLLLLPAGIVAGETAAFLKLGRSGLRFFDESGWCRLPLRGGRETSGSNDGPVPDQEHAIDSCAVRAAATPVPAGP